MNEEPGLSNIGNRMPLERDVSSALRRLSSYSAFSEGSSEAQDMLGEGLNLQSSAPDIHNRSLPLASPDRQLRSEVENSDEGELSNGSEHTQTFYQQGAVAASWVSTHHQNTVRVPIFHDAYFPDSPPATPFNQLDLAGGEDTISHDQDDGNGDWETVGDSITQSGLQSLQSVRGMYGGAVKQAGSSLANISDEGSLSSHPNMNNFEFPARKRNSFFNRNSRQRGLKDIKDTPIPIFFPTRRTSKVNGYLGRPESSTSRYMRRPRPLTNHTNPFRSPPPNVNSFSTFNTFDASSTTNHVRRSSGHKNRNYLSRLRITSSLEEEDITQQGIPLQNLPPAIPNTTHVVNWIDESKGHRTVTPNDSTDSTDSLLIGHTPLERDVVQGGIRHVAGNGHAQLPREPPGALYRNIRSVSEQRCSNRLQINNNTENVTSQAGADDNTQNAFRPFSLLTSGPSPTLDSMAPHHLQPIHDPNFRRDFSSTTPDAQHQSNGLSYRPYHPGPPSSTDWQMLYTDAQLQKMRDDARAAGTYDSQATLTPAAIGRGSGRLPRMTVESPHVYRVRRAVGDLEIAWRERRISIVVLCICNLFPPLLLLYATGYLDGIMVWWTKGKIEGFARSQKRVAFWLTAIWAACTIIGVACGIFYVVFSRHAS
ncbi:hypothetical protein F5884DRAFT_669789 [Xylogone sp. PMI_703]|nr:hypothetical protein F5884DRAFT_669789 [Xylogone sp. PMI_703]